MFRSIGREIREIRVLAVALLCAATLFVYFDALRILAHPLVPGLAHPVLLGLAALCLAMLYADGAAPADNTAGGPWPLSDRRRRRDALKASLLVFAVLAICAKPLGLFHFFQAESSLGSEVVPTAEADRAGDAAAPAGNFVFSIAILAIALLATCAPACAAIHGIRRALPESWRAWRHLYFPLFGAAALAMLALIPSAVLFQPVQAFWVALGDPRHLQHAIDICNRVGPGNIAPRAATATLLLGVVLWIFSRAVARLIEQPPG